jgi:hypothetical protein
MEHITEPISTQCYPVLHSGTQCYTVLHSATQCYAVLHSATQCYTVLPSATQCCPVLHSATQCYTVLPSATQCYPVLHSAAQCYTELLCRGSAWACCMYSLWCTIYEPLFNSVSQLNSYDSMCCHFGRRNQRCFWWLEGESPLSVLLK